MEADWDIGDEMIFVGDIERMFLAVSATVLAVMGGVMWVVFSSH
jgi:hypothetical protein